jgi:hypothetical protein
MDYFRKYKHLKLQARKNRVGKIDLDRHNKSMHIPRLGRSCEVCTLVTT